MLLFNYITTSSDSPVVLSMNSPMLSLAVATSDEFLFMFFCFLLSSESSLVEREWRMVTTVLVSGNTTMDS